MHICYMHNTFPGHFGLVAERMARDYGHRVSFIAKGAWDKTVNGVDVAGVSVPGMTPDEIQKEHYLATVIRPGVDMAEACGAAFSKIHSKAPVDLVVHHAGWIPTFILRSVMPQMPILSYIEHYYKLNELPQDYRYDRVPWVERVASDCSNMYQALDALENPACYVPTEFTRSLLPSALRDKALVMHDGIDTDRWKRVEPEVAKSNPVFPAGLFAEGRKLVTYVNRGFEHSKGFDIFMKAAKRVYEAAPDTHFVCVGRDLSYYDNQPVADNVKVKSFKTHVLESGGYDLSKFTFIDRLSEEQLACLFSVTNCHVYLSIPHILGWSLLDAMSCQAPIVASRNGAIPEFIAPEQTGLLADFFNPGDIADAVLQTLGDAALSEYMGRNARSVVETRCSLDIMAEKFGKLYAELHTAASKKTESP